MFRFSVISLTLCLVVNKSAERSPVVPGGGRGRLRGGGGGRALEGAQAPGGPRGHRVRLARAPRAGAVVQQGVG